MLWSDCPLIHDCEKCLEVEFEFEKDIACLDNKWADNSCVFEGKLVEGGSRVFVSSEQCLINGDLSIIQVLFLFLEIQISWHFAKSLLAPIPQLIPELGIIISLKHSDEKNEKISKSLNLLIICHASLEN